MQLDSDKQLNEFDQYGYDGTGESSQGYKAADGGSYDPISPAAPTAANTSNQLTNASSGLEDLLKLAVGGYSSFVTAKAAADNAKAQIAAANKNGVNSTPTRPAAAGTFAGIPQKTLLIGGGILAAVIVLVLALRGRK